MERSGGGGKSGRVWGLQGSSALDRTENKKATTRCAANTMVLYSTFRAGHLCTITVAPTELIVSTLHKPTTLGLSRVYFKIRH